MGRFVVEIHAASLDRLQDLQRIFNVDVVRATAKQIESYFVVEALVSDRDIEKLRSEGFQVEVLSDADEMSDQKMREVG
jgi:hypothetical protein